MINTKTYKANKYNGILIQIFRLFIKYIVPSSFFRAKIPTHVERKVVDGHFNLEIVSHCWGYANMLAYQLSSYVNHPPTKLSVIATVLFSEEDEKTTEVINFFKAIEVPNVTWHFQPIAKEKLFRRSIGRNMAALSTEADWIWYTDCDNIFHANCLDSLADQLQGCSETLVHPKCEYTTDMLLDDDPILRKDLAPAVIEIERSKFKSTSLTKSTGPYQIVHGDVARAIGYCEKLKIFQTEETAWRKTYEDTAFKWLINSEGTALEIENALRIRHVSKGRYTKDSNVSRVRSKIRRLQE
jgi:hypothetical protein